MAGNAWGSIECIHPPRFEGFVRSPTRRTPVEPGSAGYCMQHFGALDACPQCHNQSRMRLLRVHGTLFRLSIGRRDRMNRSIDRMVSVGIYDSNNGLDTSSLQTFHPYMYVVHRGAIMGGSSSDDDDDRRGTAASAAAPSSSSRGDDERSRSLSSSKKRQREEEGSSSRQVEASGSSESSGSGRKRRKKDDGGKKKRKKVRESGRHVCMCVCGAVRSADCEWGGRS